MKQEITRKVTIWEIYHGLWGKAHEAPEYNKQDWNELYRRALTQQNADIESSAAIVRNIVQLARFQGVPQETIDKVLAGQK